MKKRLDLRTLHADGLGDNLQTWMRYRLLPDKKLENLGCLSIWTDWKLHEQPHLHDGRSLHVGRRLSSGHDLLGFGGTLRQALIGEN